MKEEFMVPQVRPWLHPSLAVLVRRNWTCVPGQYLKVCLDSVCHWCLRTRSNEFSGHHLHELRPGADIVPLEDTRLLQQDWWQQQPVVLLWKLSRIKCTLRSVPVLDIQSQSFWWLPEFLLHKHCPHPEPLVLPNPACRVSGGVFSAFPNPGVGRLCGAQGFLPLGSAATVHIFKPNQTGTVSSLSM